MDQTCPVSSTLVTAVARTLPPPGAGRRLCVQSTLFAVGTGVFLSGNAVFFTKVVGVSAQEVGVAFTLSALVSFLLAVPLGGLADRVGPLRMWAGAAFVESLTYLSFPWVRGYAVLVTLVVLLAVVEGVGGAGRTAYTIDVVDPAQRVRVLAYMRTWLNVGFRPLRCWAAWRWGSARARPRSRCPSSRGWSCWRTLS